MIGFAVETAIDFGSVDPQGDFTVDRAHCVGVPFTGWFGEPLSGEAARAVRFTYCVNRAVSSGVFDLRRFGGHARRADRKDVAVRGEPV